MIKFALVLSLIANALLFSALSLSKSALRKAEYSLKVWGIFE